MDEKQTLILEIDVQGSVDQLASIRQSMDALIKQRQELSDKSKQGDIEATKELEKVNSSLRNLTTEYKANQRVLDGYANSVKSQADKQNFANNSIQQNRDLLKQLTAQYIQLKSPSEAATKQIKDLSDKLKEQEAAIGNTSRNVGNYKEAFQGAFQSIANGIPGLQGFATAQKGVNLAMEANPIGAVIALLTGLFQIFSQNKEIADKVSFAFSGLNKAFGFIVDTITNTVSSFDNLTNAIKHPLDFIYNLGSGSAKAAKEGYEAAKAFDELIVANAKLNSEISVGKEKADALTSSLKDRTKSEKERIAIANQIADLEISNANKLAKLRQQELNALNLQNKNRTLSGEEQAKVIQKQGEVEVAKLQASTAESQRQTRINILLDKQQTEAAKQNSDKRVQIKQEELIDFEAILAKEKKAADDTRKDYENRELDAQVVQAEITAKRVGTVEAAIDAELIARARLLQNDKLTATERENIIRKSEYVIAGIKKASAEKSAQETLQIEKQKEQDRQSIIGASIAFITNLLSTVNSLIQDSTKEQIANETQANEQRKESYKNSLDSGYISKQEYNKLISQSDAKLDEEKRKQNQKAWEANKAIQITMAIINTAQAVIAQLSNPTPYVGIALSALAAATGAIQIGIIAAQQPPKFKDGVIGLDGEGTETSDSIPAYLSKGESVMTAKATRRFHKELAWMEQSVGNNPNYQFGNGMFSNGFIPISDGGFAARDISRNADNSNIINAIKSGFALAPAPQLSIVELERMQNSRNRSINVSEA